MNKTRTNVNLSLNQSMPFRMYLKMLLGSSQRRGIQRAATKIHEVATIKDKVAKSAMKGDDTLANRPHIIIRMMKNAAVLPGSSHSSTAKEHIH